jgi:hypothetical protein
MQPTPLSMPANLATIIHNLVCGALIGAGLLVLILALPSIIFAIRDGVRGKSRRRYIRK